MVLETDIETTLRFIANGSISILNGANKKFFRVPHWTSDIKIALHVDSLTGTRLVLSLLHVSINQVVIGQAILEVVDTEEEVEFIFSHILYKKLTPRQFYKLYRNDEYPFII